MNIEICIQARCAKPLPSSTEIGVHTFKPALRRKKPEQCLVVFGAAFNRTSHFSDLWIESGPDSLWVDGLYVRSVSEPGYRSVERQLLAMRDIVMTKLTLQGNTAADSTDKPYSAALSVFKRSYIQGEICLVDSKLIEYLSLMPENFRCMQHNC